MLYVFHVDTGTMMTFDMGLLAGSVADLQKVISQACHISEDKQVLLISGGESLDPSTQVHKYHAGTDTNPIYLFSKMAIEAATPPSPSVHYGSDVDIPSQVEGSLLLPPTFGTVVARSQLAIQIHDVDKEEEEACEKLVHDQHLQQQGWAAVVANLEDITCALKHRSEIFTEAYTSYISCREDYLSTLASVASSLDLLSKIPVLPCLLQTIEDSSLSNKNLFDWISSQDPKHSLHDMVHQCLKATEQLDQQVLDNLMSEVMDTFKQVENPSMKEVKGIEDRLYGLDQILNGARKTVREQSDLAQALYQNQTRVSKLRDTSILPDLCNSHKKQLVVMVNNHKKLQETKKKCKMAKEELSVNLHTRLRWVMLVEKRICDVDGKLMIYHENLKRLRKRLDILKQIHEAPQVYAKLVVEVVRRRKFSTQFLKWASHLAVESQNVHEDEVKRRELFQREVGNHFLQSLFNGLEDSPASFATEEPKAFDQSLPPITPDDVTMLRNQVPELAQNLQVPLDVSFLMKDVFFERSLFKFDEAAVKGGTGHGLATSDIEIINNCDEEETFLTTDQSLSLEQQVASSEMDPNLLLQIQKESCTDKPELLMPKSLSEELTKQMKIISKEKLPSATSVDHFNKTYPGESAIKCESNDSAKKSVCGGLEATSESFGASTSSGEQLKSTESELSGQDKTSESVPSGKKRVRRQTDPDMETSQEFTTADFYIEDSMPSSIADSPPSKEDKPKARPLLPVEKSEEVKMLEERVQTLTQELEESKSKLQKFVNFSREALVLKCDLVELSTCVRENKNVMSSEIENTKDTLKDSLVSFQQDLHKAKRELEEERVKSIEKEETIAQCCEKEKVLKKQLSEKESVISSLNNDNEKLKQNLTDMEAKILKEKENFEKEKQELEEEHKNKIEEINKENSLELEVELDKIRAEFQEQVSELENKLTDQEVIEARLNEKIKGLSSENSKAEEKLFSQFQQEKTDITKILQAEFEEKLKKEIEDCKTSLETKHQEESESIQKAHIERLETELKEQKEKLMKEKDDELEVLSQQLNTEFDKSYQVLKETLEEDHKKALGDFMSQSEKKYQEEKLHNEEIVKKQIDELQLKLNFYTDKEFDHKESQTARKENVQQEVQTDEKDTSQTEIQTEQWQGVEMKTQTDTTPVTQQEAQTSLQWSEGMEVDTQTDRVAVVQQEAQTHLTMEEGKERNTQTDTPVIVQQEMQTSLTLNPEGMDTETQTEIKTQIPQGIQTSVCLEKSIEGTEMETQTDIRQVQQQEIQTSLEVTSSRAESEKEKVNEEKEIQTSLGDGETTISAQEHSNQLAFLQVRLTAEKDKALIEMKQKYEKDISELIGKLEKDKSDSLTAIQNSLQAEKQVAFNEAVIKLAQEKDKVIEDLRSKEKEFLEQLSTDQETILKLNEEKSKLEDIKTRAMSHLTDKEREIKEYSTAKRQLEDELAMSRQQLSQYQSQLQAMSAVSVPSVMEISQTNEVSRITTLEDELKMKSEKIVELQQKMMEMSMTASTRNIAEDKVSITSCNVGDLALFCLDDRHDQYVVFTIGNTLHFLHTDCQETLGLRPNPGETKKSWVLAEITEKEYCQAKKPQNRFKVPVGTKFYRVKAKPWKPDSGAKGIPPAADT